MATVTTTTVARPRGVGVDDGARRERWSTLAGAATAATTAIAAAAAAASVAARRWELLPPPPAAVGGDGNGGWPLPPPPVSVTTWAAGVGVFHAAAAVAAVADATAAGAGAKVRVEADPGRRYAALLPRVVANQVLLLLPAMVAAEAAGWAYAGGPPVAPTVGTLLVVAAWMAVAHDVLFYVGHRFLLHSGWGWRAFGHHLHHTTRAATAVSAMYMAPADYLIEIVGPYLLPLGAVSPRLDARWHAALLAAGCVGGVYEHSGYNLLRGVPGLDTTPHGEHHTRGGGVSFADGVGSPSLMDALWGTAWDAVPRGGKGGAQEQLPPRGEGGGGWW